MESEHFVGKVALRGVFEKDGKILVCKCPGDAVWMFPGGRLHKGEQPLDALAREVHEELGVEIRTSGVYYTEQWMHAKSNTPQVFLYYRGELLGEPQLVDSTEVDEFRWVTHEELKTISLWEDCRRAANAYVRIKS